MMSGLKIKSASTVSVFNRKPASLFGAVRLCPHQSLYIRSIKYSFCTQWVAVRPELDTVSVLKRSWINGRNPSIHAALSGFYVDK